MGHVDRDVPIIGPRWEGSQVQPPLHIHPLLLIEKRRACWGRGATPRSRNSFGDDLCHHRLSLRSKRVCWEGLLLHLLRWALLRRVLLSSLLQLGPQLPISLLALLLALLLL